MRLPMNSDSDAPEMTSVDWFGNPVYGEMILCRARAASILTGQEKADALLWDGDDSFAALGETLPGACCAILYDAFFESMLETAYEFEENFG